jgi:hypothetical protein
VSRVSESGGADLGASVGEETQVQAEVETRGGGEEQRKGNADRLQ